MRRTFSFPSPRLTAACVSWAFVAVMGCSSTDDTNQSNANVEGSGGDGTGGGSESGGGSSTGGKSSGSGGSSAGTGGSSAGGSGNSEASVGSFNVSLIAPTTSDPEGHTSVVGKVYDGPSPSQLVWSVAKSDSSCRLMKPRVPFCETPCGGSAVCVEDDTCQDYPKAHGVGTVKVTGLKTTGGATEFSMNPVASNYQPGGDVKLPYEPFAEGDAVQFDAAGGDFAAFTLKAKGIAPLVLADGAIALDRDKPISIKWTAPKKSGVSTVHVKVDISHHGGTKGMIECDVEDTGALDISATLATALLDLGVAGFPTAIVTRQSTGSASIAPGRVDLLVQSQVEREIKIAGLESCSDDSQCSNGKTCQSDLTCK